MHLIKGLMVGLLFLLLAGTAIATHEQDFFIGDTGIYSASSTYLRPNILFVVDNSAGMEQRGSFEAYDPAKDYAALILGPDETGGPPNYETNAVYERKAATGGTIVYNRYIAAAGSGSIDVTCAPALASLTANGFYAGKLKKSDGSCNAAQEGNYFLGNILNYTEYVPDIPEWQENTYYAAGAWVYPTEAKVVEDAEGNKVAFQVIEDGTSALLASDEPAWPTTPGGTVVDGQHVAEKKNITWAYPGALIDMVETTLSQVVSGARGSVNMGLMTLGGNNHGGLLLRPTARTSATMLDEDGNVVADTVGIANFAAMQAKIAALSDGLLNANAQYINEVFWDASLYFKGVYDTDSSRISSGSVAGLDYASPIDYSCQRNFVILITTGSSDSNVQTKSRFGDEDNDGDVAYVDDAAKILYEIDHVADDASDENTEGVQRVQTHVVQLMTPQVDRLLEATDSAHGRGEYFKVDNPAGLTEALLALMNNIVRDADTSFVAPVVPTSPENRTYSGQRVYLGFFNPVSQKPWMGNIKKLGLDTQNQIIDKNDVSAINDDGSFNAGAVTHWKTDSVPDAGIVEKGGAGEVLLGRDIVPSVATEDMASAGDERLIYTYLGSSTALTDSSNFFDTNNTALSDVVLGLDGETDPAGERDKLIRYIHGLDAYDNDKDESVGGNGETNEKRSWILGDILHSKPQVVNYTTYTFDATAEANCNVNEAMVYVGGNDGMLHAFRDCDGREEWAFVPPAVLDNLKFLRGIDHGYYVDGSPRMYKYDHDNDGNIEDADGDKVILFFGLRRGGEAYYALDVTIPDSPVYLWELNSSHLSELAQTWSQPVFGKVKVDDGGTTVTKVVAFVGAGYDNDSEDRRFGNTMHYPDDLTAAHQPGESDLNTTSSGATVTTTQKGRGVFAFEVATLDSSGVPTIPSSPNVVWQFTKTAATRVNSYNQDFQNYSVASDLAALDTDFDGYVDRLYVGDTGGQVWRYCDYQTSGALRPLANPFIETWLGKRIFNANTNTASATLSYLSEKGRKIFFPPSVAFEPGGQINLYFGTGDRAHPINTAVVDRMYGLFDKGQRTNEFIDEPNLTDVTANQLQLGSFTAAELSALGAADADEAIAQILQDIQGGYGWLIKLDENDGEKVLADSLVFNKVAYYTTYAPNTTVVENPCLPGNLGESHLYAVDYKTGEAVYNFYAGNDNEADTNTNTRAAGEGYVMRRADRSVSLGIGIPSGLVMVINASGDPEVLIGCGGGVCNPPVEPGGTLYPVYWLPY